MPENFIADENYKGIDFTKKSLPKADYDNCSFSNCNFSNTSLSEITFSECVFKNCDLSLVKLEKTALQSVEFIDCKLLGLYFETCNSLLFSAKFTNCILNLSSFYMLDLKETVFRDCTMHKVDFTEANLTASSFEKCDLTGAIFSNTILEKANFKTAYNFAIDPEINRIYKAKFALETVHGLLEKYQIELD
jgi:uncharacterized protein YjbI with pentapeptide repeats